MRRPRRLLVAFVFSLAALTACEDTRSIGRPCVLEHPPRGEASVIESPALDCDARLCVQQTSHEPAMCTADCDEVGQPCTPESDALCASGSFVCATPFVVGGFAGRKLCVCDTDATPAAP
jgi:hypothetical protein